jgi:glycosyltransferase involved in cell wall biosynthesis
MKRMRHRRVYGRRAPRVEVDKDLIDDLVRHGFLKPDSRADTDAIGEALSKWLRVTRQYSRTPQIVMRIRDSAAKRYASR